MGEVNASARPIEEAETTSDWLEVATAASPMPGERVCGDAPFVDVTAARAVLVLSDGLGHGPEARAATDAVLGGIKDALARDPSATVGALLDAGHHAALRTRGAAVSVMALEQASGTLSWTGAGNVELTYIPGLRSIRAGARAELLSVRGGVVGHQMPRPREQSRTIAPGDVVTATSDGISPSPRTLSDVGAALAQGAATLIRERAKATDDATVLLARARRLGVGE